MTRREHNAERALVVGMHKTGTTIVASVIQRSIPEGRFFIEPQSIAFFEKLARHTVPCVVKIIYEHWMARPSLLAGIVRGETGFRPDRVVAIMRDPRDGLISGLMYRVYECVLHGATRDQVVRWIEVVREKETVPEKHSIVRLIGAFNRIFSIKETPDFPFDTFVSYGGWLAGNNGLLHILRYEDFVAGKIAGLSTYLGMPLSHSREVDTTLQRVARTRQSGDWRTMMLPEDVTHFRDRYGDALDRWGYADWAIAPAKSDPSAGSEYIARIADEAFRALASKAVERGLPIRKSASEVDELPVAPQ